ncbi:MAG: MFS transporter [Nocardioides sp.]
MSWTASLRPLREPNFAWFFAAQSVNTLGTMMAPVALAFAVLDLTDSPTALGQVLAARTVPMIALLLYGGVISDRFPRGTLLAIANVGSATAQGIVAFLVLTGRAELWSLIVLSFVGGAVSGLSFPALASIVRDLVPRDQLQPANALMSLTRNGMTVLGPSLGALLVVAAGAGWALAVDATTWLVSAVLLLAVRIPTAVRSTGGQSAWQELREGWSYFWSVPWLWIIVVAFSALNMIHSGAISTLGPVIAQDTIGRQGWGYALSVESAGLLVTSVVLLRLHLGRPLLWGMIGVAGLALPMLALGLLPQLSVVLLAMFLAGIGVEIFGIGWNVAMQEHIDEAMLSRAYSYDALGSFVAMPIGQMVAGPLAAGFGLRPVLVAAGCTYLLGCAVVLCSSSVRTLTRQPAPVV